MGFEQLLFYWFGFWLVTASLLMVFMRNTVRAVLALVLAFFSAACLWLLLEAEFLAIILILVYVGAIMVLFLFVVMTLDIDAAVKRTKFIKYLPLALLVIAVLISEIVLVLGYDNFGADVVSVPIRSDDYVSNITFLASQLYSDYVYPFELSAVLLLLAIIAAITLTQRHEITRRVQDIGKQVKTQAQDRITLIANKKSKGKNK